MTSVRNAKRVVAGTIVAILVLTVLEFPPPIGFESRPQDNVSLFWLAFFVVILTVELATIPMIYLRPRLGGVLGILAAILNVLQAIADHLVLAYFSWTIFAAANSSTEQRD